MSGSTPTGPADARHYMSEYFRLERWEIPPADGDEGFSEFAGRVPVDDHHRGPAAGLRTGALLTNLDSVGGFLSGLSVLPRWIVTTSLMVTVTRLDHRGPLRVHGRVLRRGRNSVVAGHGRGGRGTGRRTGGGVHRHLRRPRPRGDEPGVRPTGRGAHAAAHRRRAPGPRSSSASSPGTGPTTRLDLADHLRNPWGILHGGAVAVLADVAACRAAAAANRGAGPVPDGGPDWRRPTPCSTTCARAGSGRSRPAAGSSGGLRADRLVRVAIHDVGADDRLVALGSVVVLAV